MSFRIVFMGTPQFAVPSLEALVRAGHQVAAVVCQPDTASGRRSSELQPPPVKRKAQELGIECFQPKTLRHPRPQARLQEYAPELIVVAAYGKILPKEVLQIPPRGCINVHGSLLPELRGAAPIQWAIARGYRTTGITTMLMDEGMDTGPMLLQRSTSIGDTETAVELSERLAGIGAELLVETLERWEAGLVEPRTQPAEEGVTYAPILRKEDAAVDWSRPALELAWQTRAFWPWPGTLCRAPDGQLVKIHRARAFPDGGPPGTLLRITSEGILVAAGSGSLLLEEVQPANRRAMRASEYARGARLGPGAVFGSGSGSMA